MRAWAMLALVAPTTVRAASPAGRQVSPRPWAIAPVTSWPAGPNSSPRVEHSEATTVGSAVSRSEAKVVLVVARMSRSRVMPLAPRIAEARARSAASALNTTAPAGSDSTGTSNSGSAIHENRESPKAGSRVRTPKRWRTASHGLSP